ncbi:hypothetical protein BH11PSE4_BH11PSE4_34040 [soil metagenome]
MNKTQKPIISEDEEHRVLKFVPRTSASPPHRPAGPSASSRNIASQQPAADLAKFERTPAEPDDFRHRMLANAAALALTVVLTGIGIWLAVSIADLRKTQDCVLMGRRDCARIAVPHT